MGKFRYMKKNTVMDKYTLPFKNMRLKLGQCKESLVHKIAIIRTVQFNSFIDFEWSKYGLVKNYSPYHPSHNHFFIGFF